ncbi:MAG TPA: ATP-binding protein, partial [Chitinophagaceae bacterium]
HPDDLHRLLKSFWKAVENNTDRWNEIFKIITKDGKVRNISAKSIIVRNNGKVERAVGVLQDITDVTNLQHRLLVQEVKKQKEISHISIKAQEKEREEIGKELHDNVNQLLAVAKVLLDAARNSLQAPNEFVEKSQDAIVQAIEEIRNISHAMIPPSFREDDFLNALKELIGNINVSGKIRIEQHLPANGDLASLDDERKLAVYRIVQEQLNNIMKHAKASKAALSLSKTEDLFIVIVEDDGIGIHPESGKKGIGLNNIEKRAQYFGGRMKVTSSPAAGFRLRVEIPLRN